MVNKYTREQIEELHQFLMKYDIYSIDKVNRFIEKHLDNHQVDTPTVSYWLMLRDRYKDIMNYELEQP